MSPRSAMKLALLSAVSTFVFHGRREGAPTLNTSESCSEHLIAAKNDKPYLKSLVYYSRLSINSGLNYEGTFHSWRFDEINFTPTTLCLQKMRLEAEK